MKLFALLLCLPSLTSAQFYNISTLAGNGLIQFQSGGQAINTALIVPTGVAVDASGNTYVSDTYFNQVFRITPAGVISAYAGNGTPGFSGDGAQATAAQLSIPRGLAVDSSGNLYIADSGNARVRKVTPSGAISTVSLQPYGVSWVAVDSAANLYISGGHYIFRVNSNGVSTTIAGTGSPGYSGDGGPATSAMLFGPQGLRVDSTGNVYVADSTNNRIRKITPQGIISTVAGSATGGYAGDGGQATGAELLLPADVALDGQGNLYISDSGTGRLRVVNAIGQIGTVAGGGTSLQNGAPLSAIIAPYGIAMDNNGGVVVANPSYRQVRDVAPLKSITTIAGVLPTATAGDSLPATSVSLLDPFGVAVDSAGNVYISDPVDYRIREVSPAGGISTVSGNGIPGYSGDGGLASQAELGGTDDMGIDPNGNLYVAVGDIRKISATGVITTVAGNGVLGFFGDGGQATSAGLLGPGDCVADRAGNLYISDRGNNRIRHVDPTGIITTYAGNGKAGYTGDGGVATQAELFSPLQLALDAAGNLFIADWGNSVVRKVTPTGIITTVAGGGPAYGPPGDGGPATAATIGGNLQGIAVDAAGNLYITSNSRIRKVNAATGIISTIAGSDTAGFSGDGGLATNATLSGAQSIAVDTSGNVYFADQGNWRVRKLTPAQIVKEAVVNAATFQAGGVAPGEIFTIFGGPGVALGPSTPAGLQLTAAGTVATTLSGTQVLFDNIPAALTYLSSGQINAIVPYEVAGHASTLMQVVIQGKPTNSVTLPVVATAPGIFAITNLDGSVNSASNPVAAGGVLVLYGTGEGQTAPAGVDGGVNTSVFPKPLATVSAQIGGQPVQILYAGAAPDFVAGVLQVDLQIPAGVTGTVQLQLTVGSATISANITVK